MLLVNNQHGLTSLLLVTTLSLLMGALEWYLRLKVVRQSLVPECFLGMITRVIRTSPRCDDLLLGEVLLLPLRTVENWSHGEILIHFIL